ncbi:hypothetical protein [Geomobilimonas luticola]|uniref:Uncharacterized protein n=1 Tax=Geomobilimonas luticola TaxID=1114878 RepID=A0ABS5SHD4_9BACT|nr:hypothetical protein [Geomobilimonas luticola]MBT0654778.1 hypothetical protein [Geomobilimonas luticola]
MDDNQLFNALTQYKDKLEKDALNEDVNSNANLLLAVLKSGTVKRLKSSAPSTMSEYESRLIDTLKESSSKEYIDFILYILAQAFLESLIKTNQIEVGAPQELVSRFLNVDSKDPAKPNVLIGMLPKVSLIMMRDKYKDIENDIENKSGVLKALAADVNNKVNSNIEYLKKSQELFDQYKLEFEGVKSNLNFMLLGNAFSDYIKEKQDERSDLGKWLKILAIALFVIPCLVFVFSIKGNNTNKIVDNSFAAYSSGTKNSEKKQIYTELKNNIEYNKASQVGNVNGWSNIVNKIIFILPITVAEIILLFYFRIILSHYNSAGAQLLQLKMRLSICQFIENYIKFKKDSNVGELDKFETLIFSNLMPNADQIPPTFEGLEHLSKLLGEFKPKA